MLHFILRFEPPRSCHQLSHLDQKVVNSECLVPGWDFHWAHLQRQRWIFRIALIGISNFWSLSWWYFWDHPPKYCRSQNGLSATRVLFEVSISVSISLLSTFAFPFQDARIQQTFGGARAIALFSSPSFQGSNQQTCRLIHLQNGCSFDQRNYLRLIRFHGLLVSSKTMS